MPAGCNRKVSSYWLHVTACSNSSVSRKAGKNADFPLAAMPAPVPSAVVAFNKPGFSFRRQPSWLAR